METSADVTMLTRLVRAEACRPWQILNDWRLSAVWKSWLAWLNTAALPATPLLQQQ